MRNIIIIALISLIQSVLASDDRKMIIRKYFTAGYLEAQAAVYPNSIPKQKRLYDMIVKDIFYVRSPHGYERLKDHLSDDEKQMKFASCTHGGATFITYHDIPNTAVVSETKKLINISCKQSMNVDIDKVLGVTLEDESILEKKAKKAKEERDKKVREERAIREEKKAIEEKKRKKELMEKKKEFDALFE